MIIYYLTNDFFLIIQACSVSFANWCECVTRKHESHLCAFYIHKYHTYVRDSWNWVRHYQLSSLFTVHAKWHYADLPVRTLFIRIIFNNEYDTSLRIVSSVSHLVDRMPYHAEYSRSCWDARTLQEWYVQRFFHSFIFNISTTSIEREVNQSNANLCLTIVIQHVQFIV